MQFLKHRGFEGTATVLKGLWDQLRTTAQVVSIAILPAIAACADEDPTKPAVPVIESIPVASTTVVSAVEFITQSPLKVPATCGGSLEINCVNGVPGEPASFNIARGPITTESLAPEPAYSFTTTLAVTSVNITAKASGVTCAVALNSAKGTTATLNMVGRAEFSSHTGNGVVNRLDVQADVTGIEAADVVLTGGFGCGVTESFSSLMITALTDALSSDTALCGAPGPALLKECPGDAP